MTDNMDHGAVYDALMAQGKRAEADAYAEAHPYEGDDGGATGGTVARIRAALPAEALSALSVLLDVNDDDEILTDAGVSAAGLAVLRAVVDGDVPWAVLTDADGAL